MFCRFVCARVHANCLICFDNRLLQRHALPLIDEMFLYLMYMALGSTEADLAERFGIHASTVSRIITTWTHYLYFLLGSVTIWLSKEQVQAVLPWEYKQSQYADTQVNIIIQIH